MIATTRSACSTPSSISFASSLASATEWIGTLRTSMASGSGGPSARGSAGWYERRLLGCDARAGRAGDRLGEVGKVGDARAGSALLHEPARGVHLGGHRAA